MSSLLRRWHIEQDLRRVRQERDAAMAEVARLEAHVRRVERRLVQICLDGRCMPLHELRDQMDDGDGRAAP